MGDTETQARRRQRQRQRRRRRQRLRATWRKNLDWRGRSLSLGGWYFVALSTAYGLGYGTIADDRSTGHAGFEYALIGTAAAIAWGTATTALLPPFLAGLASVISLFVALFTLGPTYPGVLDAALAAVVAGWLLGIHGRHLTVGRRCPMPPVRLADRSAPRRPAPIRPAERTQLLFSAGGACVLIGLLATTYLIPRPELLGTWLIGLGIAFLWGAPLGWWSAMTRSHYTIGGAPIIAASWGIIFNAWAASAFGGTGIVLLGAWAAISVGYIARRLLEARLGRHPRQRAATPTSDATVPR